MPIYEYRCRNGHTFEVFQSMSDEPVATCEDCGAPVERVFHPVAVHFKGSGFYTTDYAKKGAATKETEGGKDGAGKGDSGGDKSGDSSGDSKASAKKASSSADKAGKGSSSSPD